jgi:hypothetical protein
MALYRVTVTRIGVYEVQAPTPQEAGNAGLKASFSDPGPHGGFVVIEDAATGAPVDRFELSKMEPAGTA